MLVSYRRYMGILIMGILVALLLSNVVPDPLGRGIWRGGAKPDAGWFGRMHGQLQAAGLYLQDNFGFRASMPIARRELRAALHSPDTKNVYFGRNGQMFWSGQRAPEQSAGQLVRTGAVDRFVELMESLHAHLAPHGVKMVVALPPNAQSVDTDDLPAWQDRVPQHTTEYTLMLKGLEKAGIPTVDLRRVLKASPEPRRYLPNDTHWNNLSAVLAFNATVAAAGHPDWQVDVNKVIGPLQPMLVGDLARTLRLTPPLPDLNQELRLPPGIKKEPDPALRLQHEARGFNGYVIRYRKEGPRVLVVGDSYTVDIWPALFGYTPVSVAGWMHFSRTTFGACDFDYADIYNFKPDLLIIARTERMFACLNGAWPQHLPSPD
ncbi:alginate O-acetyltransferase AlgX-related protein [Roseixanthobacter liquoris]|uniref:alginate O-acetyltransferase AlgX-related protein n=1 Tax=Roseixanthobacter liquoris TaxID=3119921 RepID=UPI003728B501